MLLNRILIAVCVKSTQWPTCHELDRVVRARETLVCHSVLGGIQKRPEVRNPLAEPLVLRAD